MAPVDALPLFERATARTAEVLAQVRPGQLGDPTPCSEWDVQSLIDHLVGGPAYLLGGLGTVADPAPGDADTYAALLTQCAAALRVPGASQVRCLSPLGFEWSIGEATAGTFMDQLVHTWDLAMATGQDTALDPELVQACITMFLPQMPDRGRAAGLVGPAVAVPEGAPPQAQLLAAMGRRP